MKKQIKPLDISLDNQSALPVYEQVKQAIKWSILSGYLEEGDQLPSLRDLGTMLHINPNTIVKIYFHLEVEGFIRSQAGSGFFVAARHEEAERQGRRLFEQLCDEHLAKVSSLGFSPADIIAYLQGKIPKPTKLEGKEKEEKNGHRS